MAQLREVKKGLFINTVSYHDMKHEPGNLGARLLPEVMNAFDYEGIDYILRIDRRDCIVWVNVQDKDTNSANDIVRTLEDQHWLHIF